MEDGGLLLDAGMNAEDCEGLINRFWICIFSEFKMTFNHNNLEDFL